MARYLILLLLLLVLPSQAATGPITVGLRQGWNGVALQCSQVTSLSAPAEVAGFAFYNGSSYEIKQFTQVELNNAGGRRGLWVFANAPTSFTYSGTDESTTLNLINGWNLVSFAQPLVIPGSSIQARVNGNPVPLTTVVLPAFQQINSGDNSYAPVDVTQGGNLQPGRPYWVFCIGSVQLNYSTGGQPTPTPTPTPIPVSPGLQLLNSLRAQANLPGIGELASLTNGCQLHAQWQITNGVLQQGETPGTPGYTPEGDLAGQQSNLAIASVITTVQQDINGLMTAPFHGLLFLDPLWRNTGIGHANNANTTVKSSTAINVLGDRFPTNSQAFPITWPGNGATINLTTYTGGDSPDPLANFPGVTVPTGCPLYVLTGLGSTPPNVTNVSLQKNGVNQTGIVFDETNYTNSNAQAQAAGRAILAQRNTIIILPRNPLTAGTYTAAITNRGVTTTWTFNVAP